MSWKWWKCHILFWWRFFLSFSVFYVGNRRRFSSSFVAHNISTHVYEASFINIHLFCHNADLAGRCVKPKFNFLGHTRRNFQVRLTTPFTLSNSIIVIRFLLLTPFSKHNTPHTFCIFYHPQKINIDENFSHWKKCLHSIHLLSREFFFNFSRLSSSPP